MMGTRPRAGTSQNGAPPQTRTKNTSSPTAGELSHIILALLVPKQGMKARVAPTEAYVKEFF